MILKRYGTSYQSVEPNFNSRALTEISFRRDRVFSLPADNFESEYELLEERALTAEAEGEVHDEAESDLLSQLEKALQALRDELGEGRSWSWRARRERTIPRPVTRRRTSSWTEGTSSISTGGWTRRCAWASTGRRADGRFGRSATTPPRCGGPRPEHS